MFAPHLKRLYRTCDRIIIRGLRGSGNWQETSKRNNPGLNKRITAFQDDGFQINEENVDEIVDQSESDFHNVGGSLAKHMKETLMGKHELRHHIVKDKYFKENMPSLLTWSEKEQIRLLASTQPEEWTPEKIAESFPVTVPIVKKLLKYPWKPATKERIARHDASVMRNWKELKEGSLEIPDDLREHFLKFSERTIPPLDNKSIKVDLTPEKKIGEFERIVQRCAANEKAKEKSNEQNRTHSTSTEVSFITKESVKADRDKNRITLNELTAKIKTRMETGKDVDLPDQMILNSSSSNTTPSNVNMSKEIELSNDDVKEKALAEFKNPNDNKDVMDYPERIRIPKKAYKKGATYKVNDCFYDHDGKFLYRVLGM